MLHNHSYIQEIVIQAFFVVACEVWLKPAKLFWLSKNLIFLIWQQLQDVQESDKISKHIMQATSLCWEVKGSLHIWPSPPSLLFETNPNLVCSKFVLFLAILQRFQWGWLYKKLGPEPYFNQAARLKSLFSGQMANKIEFRPACGIQNSRSTKFHEFYSFKPFGLFLLKIPILG